MAINFLTKIFGSRNDRLLKTYRKAPSSNNAMEGQLSNIRNEQFRAKPDEVQNSVTKEDTLDYAMPQTL